jgi:hypothetical protein
MSQLARIVYLLNKLPLPKHLLLEKLSSLVLFHQFFSFELTLPHK